MTDDNPHVIWSRSGWWNFRKLRARKRKNTNGKVHRPRCGCKRSAYGKCDCGVLGNKYYRAPRSERWAAQEFSQPAQFPVIGKKYWNSEHFAHLYTMAEWRWNRVLHKARKWAKKRARRILKKLNYKIGAMEYK